MVGKRTIKPLAVGCAGVGVGVGVTRGPKREDREEHCEGACDPVDER